MNDISYYALENKLLVEDFLKGYKKFKWIKYRSNGQYYYNVVRGSILGSIHLPLSSGLYAILFPDHCPPQTVFYAVIFREEIDGRKFWFPSIITACSHFEHGLPDLEDMANLSKLSNVIGMEAFGRDVNIHTDIDVADDTIEKLVMVTYIYDSELGMMWDTIGKALHKYSKLVRNQLRGEYVLNNVKQFMGVRDNDGTYSYRKEWYG